MVVTEFPRRGCMAMWAPGALVPANLHPARSSTELYLQSRVLMKYRYHNVWLDQQQFEVPAVFPTPDVAGSDWRRGRSLFARLLLRIHLIPPSSVLLSSFQYSQGYSWLFERCRDVRGAALLVDLLPVQSSGMI
jgi:hypothetical protein